MPIEESEIFIKQVLKLNKKYRNIEVDVESFKNELPKLAFKPISPRNIPIITVKSLNIICKNVWRIRMINSDNNKGNSGGYRVFYCEGKSQESILLLGIYPKQEIKDNEYRSIAKELVEACC